jgi:hypothetical protein
MFYDLIEAYHKYWYHEGVLEYFYIIGIGTLIEALDDDLDI